MSNTNGLEQVRCRDGRVLMFEVGVGNYEVVAQYGTVMHGAWEDERDARRFAASCGGRVVRVGPYHYAKGFGTVRKDGALWIETTV